MAGTSDVLTILTNWKRPDNVRLIVDAFRAQTHPVDIAIVNNAEDGKPLLLASEAWDGVEEWRFPDDGGGPPNRFAPAFVRHDHRYVLFYDDDLLPGPRAVEHLLETTAFVNNRFATIGQVGRCFHGGPHNHVHAMPGSEWLYAPRNVGRSERPTPVDMTCRAHLVRADAMRHVLAFKWELIQYLGADVVRPTIDVHDDMLLCLGIQKATGWPSYLTHNGPPETCLKRKNLPAPHGVSERLPHHTERSQLIQWAEQLGWKSLWQKTLQDMQSTVS